MYAIVYVYQNTQTYCVKAQSAYLVVSGVILYSIKFVIIIEILLKYYCATDERFRNLDEVFFLKRW